MSESRWWDAVVPIVAAAIVAPVLILSDLDVLGRALVAASAALLIVAYFGFGRRLRQGGSTPLAVVFVILLAISIGVGVAAAPFIAMLQTLAYPLVWVSVDTRRGGVLGSVAIGFGVFIGLVAHGGFTIESLWEGILSGGLAVVFATALGLWISSIAEYGEERARLVTELTEAQSQVEALSRDRGAAEERERIARDIHDTLAQTLAGLVLLSERAGRQARDGRTDAAAEAIATIEQTAREALAESRALVARMAAVPADDALAAAIERLAARFRAEVGLAIDVEVAAGVDLDREQQVVLLRCLQEALANVRKHARATLVVVTVAPHGEGIGMTVRDDGVGFDPSAARTGFGLDGISDRATLAGGSVEVDSVPGRGSVLTILLPRAGVAA
ncbi:MAG: sensor histidine kinase [Microbacterium sp.]|uniref:sensor histidine kinase n=2 Tax=Microbacteriaceae TaxID=85023 RepID=UPI001D1796AF|nr:sensor histidine kinase [Microbacterium schleiferi]MCC4267462.1 sensor histidine kinase [Microbacterium schleiferi]